MSSPVSTLTIIIPVLNEARTLPILLQRVSEVVLPNQIKKEIIIVDNGSTDGSIEIGRQFCIRSPAEAHFISCPHRGKGIAVRTALAVASGDVILIQDADLEYEVADYPDLLRPIIAGEADFVLGSRHLKTGHWRVREFYKDRTMSTFFNLGALYVHGLFNLFYGVHLTDPSTMYKVFRRSCLKGIHFRQTGFEFDFELAGKLIRAGFPPVEVPVTYRSRGFAEGKKINLFRDVFRFTWGIIRSRFGSL